jgi:hypothetical protein
MRRCRVVAGFWLSRRPALNRALHAAHPLMGMSRRRAVAGAAVAAHDTHGQRHDLEGVCDLGSTIFEMKIEISCQLHVTARRCFEISVPELPFS